MCEVCPIFDTWGGKHGQGEQTSNANEQMQFIGRCGWAPKALRKCWAWEIFRITRRNAWRP